MGRKPFNIGKYLKHDPITNKYKCLYPYCKKLLNSKHVSNLRRHYLSMHQQKISSKDDNNGFDMDSDSDSDQEFLPPPFVSLDMKIKEPSPDMSYSDAYMFDEQPLPEPEPIQQSSASVSANASAPASNQLLQLIYTQNTEIQKNVKELLKENKELKEKISSLEAENRTIALRLSEVTPITDTFSIMPKRPFTEVMDIEDLEDVLQNSPDACTRLENEILAIKVMDPTKYVRTIWKEIMTNEVATKFSWKGTNDKICICSMALTAAIRSAFLRKFPVGEKVFAMISIKWFQTANDRLKYTPKRKLIESSRSARNEKVDEAEIDN